MSAPTQATPKLLHKFLGIGATSLAVIFLVVVFAGSGPVLQEDPGFAETMAYAMSGLAVAMAIVALLVLKPRVPQRAGGQTDAAYWSDPKNLEPIMLVWFVMEGGAILATIGFFLTGHPVVAIVMGLAIVAFWLTGPDKFGQ